MPVRLTAATDILLSPKSDRYTWSGADPLAMEPSSMLAGLTSLCTRPCACAVSSAEAIWVTMLTTRVGRSGPSRSIRARMSRPATYRIAMNRTPSASPASNTGMTLG